MTTETTPKFQIGDLVRLKSGGPVMTVCEVSFTEPTYNYFLGHAEGPTYKNSVLFEACLVPAQQEPEEETIRISVDLPASVEEYLASQKEAPGRQDVRLIENLIEDGKLDEARLKLDVLKAVKGDSHPDVQGLDWELRSAELESNDRTSKLLAHVANECGRLSAKIITILFPDEASADCAVARLNALLDVAGNHETTVEQITYESKWCRVTCRPAKLPRTYLTDSYIDHRCRGIFSSTVYFNP